MAILKTGLGYEARKLSATLLDERHCKHTTYTPLALILPCMRASLIGHNDIK